MLIEMSIRNIALIERLTIPFESGLNVLTGETGAGKSIVVDSVKLALGGRADKTLIRNGEEKASVRAVFDIRNNEQAKAFLDSLGADYEDGLVVVQRELSRSGRNLQRIAGLTVPLQSLKQFTILMMDLHGQHEHQFLMNPGMPLDFLDGYGREPHAELIRDVAERYHIHREIAAEIEALTVDAAQQARMADMLRYQIDEIGAAKLKAGEEEKLKNKMRLIENAERIASSLESAYDAVYNGSGRSKSAQELLNYASEKLKGISTIDTRFETMADRAAELYYSAQDLGYELQALLEEASYDPAEAERIGDRLDLIDKLERKYGPEIPDVLAFYQQAKKQLAGIEGSDERLNELRAQKRIAKQALTEACARLTESRKALAAKLETCVMEELKDLGMARTRFQIDIRPEEKPSPRGADRVVFMISPNPGEPLMPLADIASGGELSRIMLAFKSVSMDAGGVDTMVFDEIDTGVSGRMAQVVGEKMYTISLGRQVICVTHLPQIAAIGDAHYMVQKTVTDDKTGSTVIRLDDEGRVLELSRLVGGMQDDASSLSHARHMLESAAQAKRALAAK